MVYEKLAKIQRELIAPKGQRNDFGKYNYRSCEDILKALKPICEDNGCVTFMSNDLETFGDRIYVKATVTLLDLESGERIVSTAHAREEETKKGMDGSQITGASSSYARKYALAGLFCIDNERDSDATNKGPGNGQNERQAEDKDAKRTAQLRAKVMKYVNDGQMGQDQIDKICKYYGVAKLNELSADQCDDYLAQIKKHEEAKTA